MERSTLGDPGWWHAEVEAEVGDHYWFRVDGGVPLVDPAARDVASTLHGPESVVSAPWPTVSPLLRSTGAHPLADSPIVYEAHVRGFARTFEGMIDRLDHLVDLGIDVIELMPVHPFDNRTNYWGYMPLVWGAVHRPYGREIPAAASLAALTSAAHERGIRVWLDVVFNHTGEGAEQLRTHTLRGSHPDAYLRLPDGRYNDDSGTGNTVDIADPQVRRLVLDALDRYASLGVDGFRFDLATILTRDGGDFVRRVGDWAEQAGVALVAEAWDLAAYQVGPEWPDDRWAVWNDRFREEVRGVLRGEHGLVAALARRVAGSPDLFGDRPWRSVNYVASHDGLTLHDLTIVTDDRHRAWDCGPELRLQQLRNAFCVLLLSAGTPMFVMGDEFARTQDGHDNPYHVDGPVSWVDWARLDEWRPLYDTVRDVIALRKRHAATSHWGDGGTDALSFHRPDGSPLDVGGGPTDGRSLAWRTGDLYVTANFEPHEVTFRIPHDGAWRPVVVSADGLRLDPHDCTAHVPARTVAVFER